MTPKQCHAAHCNSHQVEGSAGWDRHSSGDLRNRQMDGQDEGSRRIYITRKISRKGGRQFGRHQEVLLVEYQKRRRRIHPRTRHEDGPWPLLNYSVDDPVPQWSWPTVDEVLTKAQFLSLLLYQIHCIGPVGFGFGFGFAHIYSERHPPNWDPTLTMLQNNSQNPSNGWDTLESFVLTKIPKISKW